MESADELGTIYARQFGLGKTKGDTTKLRLVEAAIDCLAEHGVEQTSFEAIGKRLGIGRANVRYHYRDKEELFIAAVRYVALTQSRVATELIKKAETPISQLQAAAIAVYDWMEEFPNQKKVWSLFWYFAATKPTYLSLQAQLRGQSTARLGHLIASAANRPIGAEERGLLAKSIQALLTGETIEHTMQQNSAQYDAARQRTWQCVTAILRGSAII